MVMIVGFFQGGPLSGPIFTTDTDDICNRSLKATNKGDFSKYSDDSRILHAVTKNSVENDYSEYSCIVQEVVEKLDFERF